MNKFTAVTFGDVYDSYPHAFAELDNYCERNFKNVVFTDDLEGSAVSVEVIKWLKDNGIDVVFNPEI